MKFICLGYFNQEILDAMPMEEVNSFIAESLAYGEELQKAGHVTGIELLQSPDFGKTVRNINGKVEVTDGTAVVMDKVLIPIITLEAENIAHAVELMAKHPALEKSGSFEIRRVEDINEMKEIAGK
tara:strand:- start:41 stop:418 length:378 start_codon:yes stop_codon:yes gene_type:complete